VVRHLSTEGDLAEQRCVWALQADQRLHPHTDPGVENLVCQARADRALTSGAFADAVLFYERAADIARANGNIAIASVNLAGAAWSYAFAGDAPSAVPLAVEAVALARQIGMPYAIAYGLLVLGIAVADSDPDQARACLRESLERSFALGYENANNLVLAMLLTSRVDDTPATLEMAGDTIRHLHWARQGPWLTASLNVVARALAPARPEGAAIIQGTAHAISLRAFGPFPDQSSSSPRRATPATAGGLFVEVRRETTRLLASTLGEQRLRGLRAEGDAMDEDQAVAYTLAQIDSALTDLDHPAP